MARVYDLNYQLIDTGDTTRNRDTLDTRDTRDILDTEEIRDTTNTGEIQNINDTIVCSDTAHTTTMETMEVPKISTIIIMLFHCQKLCV